MSRWPPYIFYYNIVQCTYTCKGYNIKCWKIFITLKYMHVLHWYNFVNVPKWPPQNFSSSSLNPYWTPTFIYATQMLLIHWLHIVQYNQLIYITSQNTCQTWFLTLCHYWQLQTLEWEGLVALEGPRDEINIYTGTPPITRLLVTLPPFKSGRLRTTLHAPLGCLLRQCKVRASIITHILPGCHFM